MDCQFLIAFRTIIIEQGAKPPALKVRVLHVESNNNDLLSARISWAASQWKYNVRASEDCPTSQEQCACRPRKRFKVFQNGITGSVEQFREANGDRLIRGLENQGKPWPRIGKHTVRCGITIKWGGGKVKTTVGEHSDTRRQYYSVHTEAV